MSLLSGFSAAANPVYRINAGGGAYTDSLGQAWSADTGYNTGITYSSPDSITGTPDPTLYQSERFDPERDAELTYSLAVSPGTYTVRLHFANLYDGTSQIGQRIFDVNIEDQLVLDDYDIIAAAGNLTATVEEFQVSVLDDAVDIQFLHIIENPKINAIEVLMTGVSAPEITALQLINADTDLPIAGFDPLLDGAVINLSTIYTRNLNIQADVTGDVGSVEFGLDENPSHVIENFAPYALAGDLNGDYEPWTPGLGTHHVTATAFSENGATGTESQTLTIEFTILEQGEVTTLRLINADSNLPVAAFDPLFNGAVINLAILPTRNLNIQAEVAGDVGSVEFGLDDNPGYVIENFSPYTLAGDVNGDYGIWTPAPGVHNLTATAYAEYGAAGTVGRALSIDFTVTDTPSQSPAITSLPPVTATVGVTFAYDLDATDPDMGDRLTFSLESAPAGAVINSATGLINWVPTVDQVGSNVFTARATDSAELFDEQSFLVDLPPVAATPTPIGTAMLSWIPPTENTNETPLTGLAGFRIYYGPSVDDLTNIVTINDPAITTYQVENLTSGTWYFAITAFDVLGNESDKSNVQGWTLSP